MTRLPILGKRGRAGTGGRMFVATWLSSIGRRSRSGRLAALITTAALASGAAALAVPQQAEAATVSCSPPALVSAISAANGTSGGGTVALTSGCTYTLTASNNTGNGDGPTGLPVITGNVTIQGNGATIARSSASGTPAFRLLDVAAGGSLTLSAVTLSGGLANNGAEGGGAVFSHGTLNASGATFSGNSSPSSSGTSGGAINSSGALTVTGSTFSGNSGQEGGGIFNQSTTATAAVTDSTFTGNTATIYGGGALLNADGTMTVTGDTFSGNSGPGGGVLDNDATVSITDSTFTGNTAGGNGGGAVQNFGKITITYSTLSGNSSPYGADIYNYKGYTLSIGTSIVANGQQGANCGGAAPITDSGYNVDSGTSCGFSTAHHSMTGTNPQLGPLASNGGPTQTMALAASSPAVNAIPGSTPGCTGSTDQRGITRPQGSGCDIGAYELVITSGIGPSTPTGLTATQVTSSSVSLTWNASTGGSGVTGYTVYRNGSTLATTTGTSYTDSTVAPSTTYTYTVDAYNAAGSHSAQSAGVQATTPPTSTSSTPTWVQGGAVATGSKVSSVTIQLTGPVAAGDLLAGWFGQYNASGQVQVSDNVNGTWTRAAASTKFSGGTGDIALFYVQNAAAAPNGLTVTITAAAPTYLQGVAADYSGVATSGSLDQTAVAAGSGTAASAGPTGSAGAGELLFSGLMTGTTPNGATAGGGLVIRSHTGTYSVDDADAIVATAGPQTTSWQLSTAADWYEVTAVFHAG